MRGILAATAMLSSLTLAAVPAAAINPGADAGGGFGAPVPGAGAGVYGGAGAAGGFPASPQAPDAQGYGSGAPFGEAETAAAPAPSGPPPGGDGLSVAGLFDRIGSGFSQLYRAFTTGSGKPAEPGFTGAAYDPRPNQVGVYGDAGAPVGPGPGPGADARGWADEPPVAGVQSDAQAMAQARAMLIGSEVVSADGAVLGTVTDFGIAEGGHSYLGVVLRDGLGIGLDNIRISTENAAITGQGVQLGESRDEFVVSMRSQLDEATGSPR